MSGPLMGVRVLDIGTLIAGPFAASIMADFGAEVIKVEQPGAGDPLRHGDRGRGEGANGLGLHWLVGARNKCSITLNLRAPEGQQLLLRLVRVADVLIENFTPGTLERWNLGPARLRAENPRLIVLRVSGFGQTGPYSRRPGYDRIALGYSGMMYPTGYPDRPPVRPAFAIADFTTAMWGCLSVLMALYHRDAHHGPGQEIDLALYEPLLRISEDLIPAYDRRGVIRERIGNRNPGFSPAGNFLTRDGRWLQVAAGGDGPWRRLATAIGRPELADDPRYATAAGRIAHADELEALLAEWIGARDYDEAFAILDQAGVPVGGIYTAADIVNDPHFLARENIISVEHPALGSVKMPGIVPRFSQTPGEVLWPGEELGAHNESVYRDLLGLDAEAIAALRERGVI